MNMDDDAMYHGIRNAEDEAAHATWLEQHGPQAQTPAVTGVISSGTLRPQDLIPAFIATLEALDPQFAGLAALHEQLKGDMDWDSEDTADLIADLMDGIHDALPEGWAFGTVEGDGACFHIWEDEDYWVEMAERRIEDHLDGL